MRDSLTYEIEGEEKASYLAKLDSALETLSAGIRQGISQERLELLAEFGKKNSWDWSRLPEQKSTDEILAQMVDRARQDYQWLDWQAFPKAPAKNRGYFEKINISKQTGLPWQFDIVELHSIRKNAAALLAEIPEYSELSKQLRELLTTDYIQLQEVAGKAAELNKSAMKRNFLEQIADAELISWEASAEALQAKASKRIQLGGETLWNLSHAAYSMDTGMFHIYAVDLWQDNLEEQPQIAETGGKAELSYQLKNSLRFGTDNAAWYILRSIDAEFESLHPVAVTRAIIGPFENKYLTRADRIPVLPITEELLRQDPETALLRASVQYSYAPNHQAVGEQTRQVVHREDWRDEFVVCPASCSSAVSQSVLGTRVKICEYR